MKKFLIAVGVIATLVIVWLYNVTSAGMPLI